MSDITVPRRAFSDLAALLVLGEFSVKKNPITEGEFWLLLNIKAQTRKEISLWAISDENPKLNPNEDTKVEPLITALLAVS